jgi:hypothetical protein
MNLTPCQARYPEEPTRRCPNFARYLLSVAAQARPGETFALLVCGVHAQLIRNRLKARGVSVNLHALGKPA